MPRGSFFKDMTPEQRVEFDKLRTQRMRERKAQEEAMEKATVVEIVPEHDFRLPHARTPLTSGGLHTFLKKADIPVTQFRKWVGMPLPTFCQRNTWMNLRKVIICALENKETILAA